MNRELKWHKRYLNLAKEVSEWSKDPSKKIGAVLVSGDGVGRVISQGYNGLPRKMEDEDSILNDRNKKYDVIIHAEMNALCNALITGTSTLGSTMYVYGLPPCKDCAKFIAQSGVEKVVYYSPYFNDSTSKSGWEESCNRGYETLVSCNVEVIKINDL